MGVGNKAHPVSAKVELSFMVGKSHQFTHVFHALHTEHDMIIGMDFMSAHHAAIDFKEATIRLNNEYFKLSPPQSKTAMLKTTKPVMISAYTATSVPVKFKRKEIKCNYMLISEPKSLELVSPDLSITLTVIACDKDENLCRVVNTSATPVCIPAGSVIALAETLPIANVLHFEECLDMSEELKPEEIVKDGNDIKLNFEQSKLTEEEKVLVTHFVKQNIQRFAMKLDDLGRNSDNPHFIKTGTARPLAQRYYRTSPTMQREIERQIKELLKHGLIEPSKSKWRSPVLLVKKQDGSFRLVCDYRNLNKVTEKESFPLPRLEDIWDLIDEKKSQYFSVLDLSSGFWQLELDESTKHKTSFVTRCGQYQWNVLPFGLTNSPITFQQTMNQVLDDLILTCCVVYVDDIVVFSPDLETHLNNLQKVFDRLEQAGLKLKLSKCRFAVQRVKCLGHLLTPEGVLPNPEKVEVIRNYPQPKNVKQVRQFLGLCNYYRRFQKNYSKVAKPLHRLTQNNVPWHWSQECQDAFNTLTTNLTTAPILKYADMNRPFILTTDASSYAIGYILSQKDEHRVERVIEYAGRSLRKSEVSYGITDREGLAVVEGFKHFHSYLYGHEVTVITDHNALKFIRNNTKLTGRVPCWAIHLSNYDYNVIYKPGAENTNADAISRLENLQVPPEDKAEEFPHADILTCNPVPADMLIREELREYPIFSDELPASAPSIFNFNELDIPNLQ